MGRAIPLSVILRRQLQSSYEMAKSGNGISVDKNQSLQRRIYQRRHWNEKKQSLAASIWHRAVFMADYLLSVMRLSKGTTR